MASFGIVTPRELLEKLLDEQCDFEKEDCLSPRHAINAAMTAYHLHEWVWGAFAKQRFDLHRTWQLSQSKRAHRDDFRQWLEKECPAIADARRVTDGTKHFNISAIPTGKHQGGFQRNAFQADAFDVSRLWIERDGQRQSAEEFITELVEYWSGFFSTYEIP
jgi:hypothetical protein